MKEFFTGNKGKAEAKKKAQTEAFQQALDAISNGDLELLGNLLGKTPDLVGLGNGLGYQLIHAAAQYGQKAMVDLLLAQGAKKYACDKEGKTPLHYAVTHKQKAVIEVLSDPGRGFAKGDNDDITPLHQAAEQGLTEIVIQYLDNIKKQKGDKAVVEIVAGYDKFGRNLLHFACLSDDARLLQALLKFPIPAEILNTAAEHYFGSTPLHLAAWWGRGEHIDLLLKAGANPAFTNSNDNTPLQVAENQNKANQSSKQTEGNWPNPLLPLILRQAQENNPAKGLPYPVLRPSQCQQKTSIGEGTQAKVYKGNLISPSGDMQIVALKRFKSTSAKTLFPQDMQRELRLMQQKNPYFVQLLGVCWLKSRPVLVLEYCDAGDLYALLHEDKKPLDWEQRWRLLDDITRGLAIIHRHAMFHRDLKSRNILLVTTPQGNLRARLSDFGLAATEQTIDSMTTARQMVGTYGWMAPELLSGKRYTAACDLYSLSVIAGELITGAIPFANLTLLQLKKQWKTLKTNAKKIRKMQDDYKEEKKLLQKTVKGIGKIQEEMNKFYATPSDCDQGLMTAQTRMVTQQNQKRQEKIKQQAAEKEQRIQAIFGKSFPAEAPREWKEHIANGLAPDPDQRPSLAHFRQLLDSRVPEPPFFAVRHLTRQVQDFLAHHHKEIIDFKVEAKNNAVQIKLTLNEGATLPPIMKALRKALQNGLRGALIYQNDNVDENKLQLACATAEDAQNITQTIKEAWENRDAYQTLQDWRTQFEGSFTFSQQGNQLKIALAIPENNSDSMVINLSEVEKALRTLLTDSEEIISFGRKGASLTLTCDSRETAVRLAQTLFQDWGLTCCFDQKEPSPQPYKTSSSGLENIVFTAQSQADTVLAKNNKKEKEKIEEEESDEDEKEEKEEKQDKEEKKVTRQDKAISGTAHVANAHLFYDWGKRSHPITQNSQDKTKLSSANNAAYFFSQARKQYENLYGSSTLPREERVRIEKRLTKLTWPNGKYAASRKNG